MPELVRFTKAYIPILKKSLLSIILKLKHIILLVFLCSSTLTFGQSEEQGVLAWGEFLHWSDFKGKPVKSSPYLANTNSGFSFTWSYGTEGFKYEITAYFYPKESWVKPGHRSKSLLSHEQLHFDISELFARKLRRKLAAIEPSKTMKSEIRNLSSKTKAAREHYQDEYDKETNHGVLIEKQDEWESRIDAELKALKDFR